MKRRLNIRIFRAFALFLVGTAAGISLSAEASFRDCLQRYFRKASPDSVSLGALYDRAKEHVAPAVIGATDSLLRQAASTVDPKVIFIGRDGLGGYKIAQTLLERFPERYAGMSGESVRFLFLNKDTISSPLAVEYLRQSGVSTGTPTFYFDLGWYGSLDSKFRSLTRSAGGKYEGLYLVLSPQESKAYIHLHDKSGPFSKIPGNPAVHFLEDTFSGVQARPTRLGRDATGRVEAVFQEAAYSEAELAKRHEALRALAQAAQDISRQELGALTPQTARDRLFDFMGKPAQFKPLMVPHER